MTQAYRNLRHFIYLNVKAQYRGEGYRLVRKLLEEVYENERQRAKLDEILKGRKLPPDWLEDAGVPACKNNQ